MHPKVEEWNKRLDDHEAKLKAIRRVLEAREELLRKKKNLAKNENMEKHEKKD
ncbi:MAG: hypothetical protein KKF62_18510 [Bacteroidetes bacterium]|nr:hypothetical protein [Bacteroidota bacterium]MBU1114377.1 hypothetical protein [Bacteroidota bacterium]MBU1798328.1 hypothetical protein [Bacteroidota bacterium]